MVKTVSRFDPSVPASTFFDTFLTDVNQGEFALWFDDAVVLRSFVEVLIGDVVDGHSASKAFEKTPSCHDLSPSGAHFAFKHLRLGTRTITTHSEHGVVEVAVVFQIRFKRGHECKEN